MTYDPENLEDALKTGWIFLYLKDAPNEGQFRAFHGTWNAYADTMDELLRVIERIENVNRGQFG